MVQAVGFGFPLPTVPEAAVDGAQGAKALEEIVGNRPVKDPVGLAAKLAEKFGTQPEKIEQLRRPDVRLRRQQRDLPVRHNARRAPRRVKLKSSAADGRRIDRRFFWIREVRELTIG